MRAIDLNLALCQTCETLTDVPGENCLICGRKTALREQGSLQKVWALWFAAIIAYIPGNIFPIMITRTTSGESPATILGGVELLIHHKSYAIAGIIFLFSIIIPLSKFTLIAWLALSIQKGSAISEHRRHFVYEMVELVGRWSMIDVFVVATLAALIQVGGLMSINPGIGVLAFAISVILTVISAGSLDPRLIWDAPEEAEKNYE